MKQETAIARGFEPLGGLAGWLLDRLRRRPDFPRRLTMVERIALAPRQSLALIEAEGRRFLVATSQEGAPSFYPLDRSFDEHRDSLQTGAGTSSNISSQSVVGKTQC